MYSLETFESNKKKCKEHNLLQGYFRPVLPEL